MAEETTGGGTRNRRALAIGAIAVIVAGAGGTAYLFRDRFAPAAEAPDYAAVEVRTIELRPNVHLLSSVGPGVDAGNVVAQSGPDGVLLVDTQYHQLGTKLLAAIRSFTDRPVTFIVNTHVHVDHVGGNEIMSLNGNLARRADGTPEAEQAPILAHENVLKRLMGPPPQGRRPQIWPTRTYATPAVEFEFNGELVRVLHEPKAHTDGDSIVQFTQSRVISAGDIFNMEHYPFVNHANGGTLQGIIDALGVIAMLAEEPGTLIVPGHGDASSRDDVVAYREMLITIRDRVAEMIRAGMSLGQIRAARPTAEFDDSFGRDSGFWTTNDFVEAVYLQVMKSAGSAGN